MKTTFPGGEKVNAEINGRVIPTDKPVEAIILTFEKCLVFCRHPSTILTELITHTILYENLNITLYKVISCSLMNLLNE